MTPSTPTPPPGGLPPFVDTGLSHGRVVVTARPAHGPADVERIARGLRRLRGLRDVGLAQHVGDAAEFVLDLTRPIALASDLRAIFGRALLSCTRTHGGFALELEPVGGDAPPAPETVRPPLGARRDLFVAGPPTVADPPVGGPPPARGRPVPGSPRGPGSPPVPGSRRVAGSPAVPGSPHATPPAAALPAGPRARSPLAEPATPERPRRGRRLGGARTPDVPTEDGRLAILTIDRDLVIRSASGGLFRAFAEDDRPIVGRPLEVAVGRALRPLAHDHALAAWRGEPTNVTVRDPRGERVFELRFLPPRGHGFGAVCTVTAVDVTEDREAVAAARELDAVLEAALATSPAPMGLLAADGRWLRANPPLEALLGFREADLATRTVAELTQIDDRQREAYLRDCAVRDGEPSFELEKRMVRADGGVIVVVSRTAIVRDGDEARGFVVHLLPDGVADTLPRLQVVPEPPPRRRRLRRPGSSGTTPED